METTKQIDIYTSSLYDTPADRIALCLINGQAVQHRFLTVNNIGRFIPFLQAMNVQGWNIYITPSAMKTGALRRTKANFMSEQDVIYIDADDKQVMEEVRSKYPYPALVVKTSVGHYQIYWKLTEKISIGAQESLMKRIAQNVGSDIGATDVSRILRLPGFWNKKPGKDNSVEVVFIRKERTQYKRFLEVTTVSPPQSVRMNVVSQGCGGVRVQKRDKHISDIIGRDGERLIFPSKSEEDWYLVNSWIRQGVPREECIQRLRIRRAGEKRNVDYYARKTLENALKKGSLDNNNKR